VEADDFDGGLRGGWLGWLAVERGSLPLSSSDKHLEAYIPRGQFAVRTENHSSAVLLRDAFLRRFRILEEAGRSYS
jgi:hypothetical protein